MLAGNLGYVPQNAWHLLLRLWPIFLVGIGLDLVFGSTHSTWAAIGRVFLGLLLIAGLFWLAMAIPGRNILKPMDIHQPLDNATSAQLEFNLAAVSFICSRGRKGYSDCRHCQSARRQACQPAIQRSQRWMELLCA